MEFILLLIGELTQGF